MRQEQNEATEAMERADMAEAPTPQVRGMGGSGSVPSGKVKGLPDRSASQPQPQRPRGRKNKGSVTDLLAIFGQAGVANINVKADA